MTDGSWNEAVRRSRETMRAPTVKRFYKVADVAPEGGGFALSLDGRIARTPAKAKLVVPSEPLARALAAEWAAQRDTLVPATMPLTRLVNSAIDGVAKAWPETVAAVAAYAGSDLVCYRAQEPDALVARHAAAFDPVLAFAEATLRARFVLAGGIMPVAQAPAALEAVRAAVAAHVEPVALAALSDLTSLSGSALIALAVSREAMTPQAAWAAAHVDEDFQIERWGRDAETELRRAAREREFNAAAFALAMLQNEHARRR